MVEVKEGSIFQSQCQTIVNTVNCVGVMGKGLALEMRNRFPEMYNEYKEICKAGALRPGMLWIWEGPEGKKILNFPTKDHWRNPSKYEWIEDGLKKFCENYKEKGITSIAFPPLGCSNGWLDLRTVLEIMSKYLEPLDIPVEIWIN